MEEKEIMQTVRSLNEAWAKGGDINELENYFHETMVAITPTDNKRIEGKENCVNGWKQFCVSATIHSWEEYDHKIQVYGDGKFAIMTYYFDMSFDMNGQTIDMKGRDMFALVKEDGKWLVVADQFSPSPQQ